MIGCTLAEEQALCGHQWTDDTAVLASVSVKKEIQAADDMRHIISRLYPVMICTECGEVVYGGTGAYALHSYTVKAWESYPNGTVSIDYQCMVCMHTCTMLVERKMLFDSTSDYCLTGGACDIGESGYLNKEGQILSELHISGADAEGWGEKAWFSALIYEPAEKTFLWGERVYCPLCGRPRVSTPELPTTYFDNRYNGLPIMTKEYFLTVDMPDNLPYQLIDQLRKEAGVA